jgi:uncharacterized protein (TIGR03083 family)
MASTHSAMSGSGSIPLALPDVRLSAGYQASRLRIAGLLDEDVAQIAVPACPAWNVHDLVAHLVGVAEALVARDFAPPHAQPWIDRLVSEREALSVGALLADWDACADDIDRLIDARFWAMVADVVVHEHDLRGALDAPGARAEPEVGATVEQFLRIHAPAITRADLGPLAVDCGAARWSSHPGAPGCTLLVDAWEAGRVLASRRTADELRNEPVEGDIAPYLAILEAHSPLPVRSLHET